MIETERRERDSAIEGAKAIRVETDCLLIWDEEKDGAKYIKNIKRLAFKNDWEAHAAVVEERRLLKATAAAIRAAFAQGEGK